MKSLIITAAIFLLSVCTFAQTTEKATEIAAVKTPSPGRASTKQKIEIPAEKLAPVVIPKLDQAIVIDGRPDEEAWKSAAVFKDFYQISPGNNTAPSKPTEVLMMYDEKHLYVAFRCWDEKDKIRATFAKRDEVFGEDNVRIWLDTYDDKRRAYLLGFNPYGIQQDAIFTEERGPDYSVDIVMESKGVIEDWGWSVEAKIPFKSLRYSAGKGKMWGFNVGRNIDRFNDEMDQWLPNDRDIAGKLIQAGRITGLDEIKYERTLELVPSVTISETGSRKTTIPNSGFSRLGRFDPIFNPIGLTDPGKFVNDPIKYELGLNLKYTLSPNITLDAAINPDFAEIEADAPVVTANRRFPVYFEEKRPFFLEGKEIFDTKLRPFYSRSIIDPDFAAKLTGKAGKNTFGFLVASDNAPGNYSQDERGELAACQEARKFDPPSAPRRCGIEEFLGKNALFAVLRVKRDVGSENSLGFSATARTFPKNRNFTGGFDGKFKLNPRTVVGFQVLGTHSREYFYSPDTDQDIYRTGNGVGYFANIDYGTDQHGMYFEAVGRSADYRADAGFTNRTDTNSFFFQNRVSTKSRPKSFLIRADFRQNLSYAMNWQGRLQSAQISTNFGLSLHGSLFVNGEFGIARERIYEDEFGAKRNPALGIAGAFVGDPVRTADQPFLSINANKTINSRLSVFGFVGSIFNAIDYDFGGGPLYPRSSRAFVNYLNSPAYGDFLGQLQLYQANPVGPRPVVWAVAPPPALDPGKGWQFDAEIGGEYRVSEPFRIGLQYSKSRLKRNDTGKIAFDSDLITLRTTYQFTRFTFVRARWDYDSLRRNASGQVLFGWNPNPGTAFYVGYNDNFNYNGFNPHTGQYEPRFERNSRTFFIRASYLFRKSF